MSTKNLPPLLLLYNSRSVLLIVEAFSFGQQLNTFTVKTECAELRDCLLFEFMVQTASEGWGWALEGGGVAGWEGV